MILNCPVCSIQELSGYKSNRYIDHKDEIHTLAYIIFLLSFSNKSILEILSLFV